MLIISLVLTFGTAAIEYLYGTDRLVVIIPYACIVPAVLLIPRLVQRYLLPAVTTEGWIRRQERLQLLILLLNAPASLWFHRMGFQYDRYLHFMVGILLVPYFFLWYVALRRRMRMTYRLQIASFILLTSFIGVISVFAWEFYQHTVDVVFGTQLFFDSKQEITVDFWEDITFGLLGMGVGFAYLRAAYHYYSTCFTDGV